MLVTSGSDEHIPSLNLTALAADNSFVPLDAHPSGAGQGKARPLATRFIARQPIFDRSQQVYGYELLHREGLENCFSATDADAACRSMLDSSLLMGLDSLCSGTRSFVNCTRDALIAGHVTLLPSASTIVEVLESVPADEEVLSACRNLQKIGYRLALDDFTPGDAREPLAELADIIKVDLLATPRQQWREMVEQYSKRSILMVAEKVETHEQFLATRDMGYTYFQGYFFQKPVIYSTSEIPHTQLNYLRMLQMVYQKDLDWMVLEKIIKHEASLCYRLLRYLNSAFFGFSREIRSVRHALTMLGEREIRKWITLVATVGAGRDKPEELVRSALVRGHFCETLSSRVRKRESDYFLLGLFSLMDAILGMSLSEILSRVPVDHEIKATLLGQASPLRPLYELVLAQETADWTKCSDLAHQLKLSEGDVSESYLESIEWAREIVSVE